MCMHARRYLFDLEPLARALVWHIARPRCVQTLDHQTLMRVCTCVYACMCVYIVYYYIATCAEVCTRSDTCTRGRARTHLAVIQHSGFQKVLDRARLLGVDVRHELERSRTLLERRDEFFSSLRQRLSEERLPVEVEEVKGKHAHAARELVHRHVLARALRQHLQRHMHRFNVYAQLQSMYMHRFNQCICTGSIPRWSGRCWLSARAPETAECARPPGRRRRFRNPAPRSRSPRVQPWPQPPPHPGTCL